MFSPRGHWGHVRAKTRGLFKSTTLFAVSLLLWEIHWIGGKILLLWVWTKSYVAKWPTNDVQGDAGYQDVIESANMLAEVCYLQSLNTSFPSLWLCRFNFFLLIRLRIFVAAATSKETRRSVDWIHWRNWSKNKEGNLVTLCMLYWSHWCAPCLLNRSAEIFCRNFFCQINNMPCCFQCFTYNWYSNAYAGSTFKVTSKTSCFALIINWGVMLMLSSF